MEGSPDESLINNQGKRYDYLAVTKGKAYAMIYTYTGRTIEVNLGKFSGDRVKCTWFSPANGKSSVIGKFVNKGRQTFDPPGEEKEGNDWVLLLDGY